MKKLSIIVFLSVLIGYIAVSQSSNEPAQNVISTKFEVLSAGRDAASVLVFRDQLPWGYDVVVPYLINIGASVTAATSAEMTSIDLAPYCLVVFESNQPPDFYYTYNSNLAKFTTWVTAGGILEFHACVFSSTRTTIGSTPLPGGAATYATSWLDLNNYIVDGAHPIVSGLVDPLNGSAASHDAFMNLPGGTNIITKNSNELPTTIEYTLGSGTVIATGMTWEIAYGYGWNFGIMTHYCLDYTTAMCNAAPVPVSNWALVIGVVLILAFTLFRFRRGAL